MSASSGRISRKSASEHRLFSNHRRALPHLLNDFEYRCAYSLRLVSENGGEMNMEVDHFDPRPHVKRNRYGNLFLSTRLCNNRKGNHWPNDEDRKRGIRFLNCCEEVDYGKHIFEDPDTHEVFGVTPEGRYHVRRLDLNDPEFVSERKERTRLHELLKNTRVEFTKDFSHIPQNAIGQIRLLISELEREISEKIPMLPTMKRSDAKSRD